jgi:hypothetical protein
MILKNVQSGIQVRLIPIFMAARKGREMKCVKKEGKKWIEINNEK